MKLIQSIKVATFPSYNAAKQGMNYLADGRFAMNKVSLLTDDIRFSESSTDGNDLMATVFKWLVLGGAVGAVLGALYGANQVMNPIGAAITDAVYGALMLGITAALLAGAYRLLVGARQKGEQLFTEEPSALYHISVESDAAEHARVMLQRKGLGTDDESY